MLKDLDFVFLIKSLWKHTLHIAIPSHVNSYTDLLKNSSRLRILLVKSQDTERI